MQVILLLGQNYHYDLGPDVSMVVALSLDTAGSSPRYIPAILPDNVQVNIQQANIKLYFTSTFSAAHRRRLGEHEGREARQCGCPGDS